MDTISADLGEYVGILYEHGTGEVPVGAIGPSRELAEVAKEAGRWIADCIEWEGKRKVVIAYRPDDVFKPMEVDCVLVSGPLAGDTTVRTLKLVEA